VTILTLTRIPAVLLVSGWSLLSPFLQPDAREGREGLRSYDRSEWSDAVDRFGRAREARPDGRYDFDLGTAAYRAGDFESAAEAFGAAARSADLPRGGSSYNLGNARFKAGDLEGALAAYRAALGANPGDEDARTNYELALRELQAAQQQQKNEKQGNKSDQERKQESKDSKGEKENPDSTQAQQGEQQKQEEQKKQDEQQKAQEQASQQEQGEKQQQPAEPERMLTPEQAAQLLNQVTPEERELLEARLKAARRRPAEKDW
jgi:Ca-activated chloride channel family protein